ncbi:MAG: DUF3180 domain-containing protein [Gulosibacter sp.]|uniref:DUF3180 domain-containing protein n=1 Tax=Gulosibacter sp. TaxID=2817531 RepID=UPI003F92E57C
MTRTNPWLLLLLVLAGGAVGWAAETWLTSNGSGTLLPSMPFSITLLGLAVVVLAIAWPVRRYTVAVRKANEALDRSHRHGNGAAETQDAQAAAREVSRLRVDPFRATFAVALAKASSLAGSLFMGGSAAALTWLLTRTVVGSGVAESVFATIAAAVLVIAGIIAESWCVLPPEDGEGAETLSPS